MFASPGASAGKGSAGRTCTDTNRLITKSLGGGIIVKSDATLTVVNRNVAQNRVGLVDLMRTHTSNTNNYRLWVWACFEKINKMKIKERTLGVVPSATGHFNLCALP